MPRLVLLHAALRRRRLTSLGSLAPSGVEEEEEEDEGATDADRLGEAVAAAMPWSPAIHFPRASLHEGAGFAPHASLLARRVLGLDLVAAELGSHTRGTAATARELAASEAQLRRAAQAAAAQEGPRQPAGTALPPTESLPSGRALLEGGILLPDGVPPPEPSARPFGSATDAGAGAAAAERARSQRRRGRGGRGGGVVGVRSRLAASAGCPGALAAPVYGWDLRRAVTLPERGALGAARASLNPRNRWRLAPALRSAVHTASERWEQWRPAVEAFTMVIPGAAVRRPARLGVSTTPRDETAVAAVSAKVQRHMSPSLHMRHPWFLRTTAAFPDRRLVQYDCGKLQVLDSMLRRLKTEGHKVLIFTQMSKMLDVLERFLSLHGHTYLRLDGGTKVDDRQRLMERFNRDPKVFAFILSTRSGGIGVNLTGADTVIFYDSDWNPAMDAQAQDRAHRIGQTRDVHIYRLVTQGTVEENILKKARQKRHLNKCGAALCPHVPVCAFDQPHSLIPQAVAGGGRVYDPVLQGRQPARAGGQRRRPAGRTGGGRWRWKQWWCCGAGPC